MCFVPSPTPNQHHPAENPQSHSTELSASLLSLLSHEPLEDRATQGLVCSLTCNSCPIGLYSPMSLLTNRKN